MAEEDDGSKTEAPSEKKLKKSREKGDVPITKETGQILSNIAMLVLVTILAPRELPVLAGHLGMLLETAPVLAIGAGHEGIADLMGQISGPLFGVLTFMAKVMGLFLVAALIGALAQGPFVFSAERIRIKPSKVNPLQGVKRILGMQNLVEFLKNLTKLSILIAVTLWLLHGFMEEILPGGLIAPEMLMSVIGDRAGTIMSWIAGLMLPVVLADYMWKRISYFRKQRMSFKEVKDEHKESEGDPLIKSRREQTRRRRIRQLIRKTVPTATLVVTNPTHFAVALRYERGVDKAPVCVAKGADLLAHKIREIAHDNEVPVIESRALARALFAKVEVDEVIPELHWGAVAELVAFVFDLKNKVKRKPPSGAQLRYD